MKELRSTAHGHATRAVRCHSWGTRPFDDVPLRSCSSLYTSMPMTPADPAHTEPSTERRPLLVNVIQAAEMLAVSRSSIYQLVWNEQLVPIRIGRSVRFSIDDIEDFVARRSTEGSR